MNPQTKRVAKSASETGTILQVGKFYFASKSIFAGTVLPPRIMGQAAGTKAAQGILKSMSEYQKRYIWILTLYNVYNEHPKEKKVWI